MDDGLKRKRHTSLSSVSSLGLEPVAQSLEPESVAQSSRQGALAEDSKVHRKTPARAGTSAPTTKAPSTSKKAKILDQFSEIAIEAQLTKQKKIDARVEIERIKTNAKLELKRQHQEHKAELSRLRLANELKVQLELAHVGVQKASQAEHNNSNK